MANKAAVQMLQAKEKVMQDEIEKYNKLQKGQSICVLGEKSVGGALFGDNPPSFLLSELQKYAASRMQLDTQINENKTVKEVKERHCSVCVKWCHNHPNIM